jgi:hypothetical protein
MKRTIAPGTVLALVVCMLMVLASPRTVPAKGGCSNATLHGSYGIRATGDALSGPAAGPIAIVGVLTFDGMGQLTLSLTQRLNSASGPTTLSKVPYIGSYNVNPDCTFDDVWHNLSNGTSSIHEAVIVDQGKAFFIINTTEGPTVVSGEAHKKFGSKSDDD